MCRCAACCRAAWNPAWCPRRGPTARRGERDARAAAEYVGSRHSTVVLSADELVAAQWAPLAAHDLPTGGDMWTSAYLLFREIRKQSTVALSGESADEVFGGYPWYHVPALLAAPTFPWAAAGSWEH